MRNDPKRFQSSMSLGAYLSITAGLNTSTDISTIVITLVAFTLLAGAANSVRSSNLLRLEPPFLNNSRYVARVDSKFRISCVCQEVTADCFHLTWRNEFGRKIDGESSNSLFTVELREHDTMYKKLSLVFAKVAKRDAGFYKCVARNAEKMTADWEVELIVVDKIRWKESSDLAGAMLGESLTIDCGATGNPQPETHITDQDGFPLNESLFVVAGSEITVNKLTKEYQDIVIKCLSVQEFTQYDATVVEQHEIRLDAKMFRRKVLTWDPNLQVIQFPGPINSPTYQSATHNADLGMADWQVACVTIPATSPKFTALYIERYVVLNHLAQICCNVSHSNPPATHFRYLRGSEQLWNDSGHVILIDSINQSSCLKILQATEDDLGEYQCEASNGKSKSKQTIFVKEAMPPGEVHVSLQDVGMTYVVWKLEEGPDEQLPLHHYTIEYIKKSILDQGHDRSSEDNRVWFAHAVRMEVRLSKDGLYEIGGLRQGTTYIFRFTAQNEAGTGDTVTVAVKTTSRIKSSKPSSSASLIIQHATPITALVYAVHCL